MFWLMNAIVNGISLTKLGHFAQSSPLWLLYCVTDIFWNRTVLWMKTNVENLPWVHTLIQWAHAFSAFFLRICEFQRPATTFCSQVINEIIYIFFFQIISLFHLVWFECAWWRSKFYQIKYVINAFNEQIAGRLPFFVQ